MEEWCSKRNQVAGFVGAEKVDDGDEQGIGGDELSSVFWLNLWKCYTTGKAYVRTNERGNIVLPRETIPRRASTVQLRTSKEILLAMSRS